MRRRVARTLLALTVSLTVTLLPLLALSAAADIQGPCTATLESTPQPGRVYNANDIDSPGNAAEVDEGSQAVVTMQATQSEFAYHRIQLEFGGFRWTVADDFDEGANDREWSDSVNVDDYATYGVGLYKVVGYGRLSDGQECIGIGYVKVTGRNPLTTVAGAAGAAVTAVGVVGVAAAGAGAVGAKKPEERVMDEIEKIAQAQETQKELDDARKHVDELEDNIAFINWLTWGLCLLAALPALLLTGMSMAAGGGTPAAPEPRLRLRRARWGPRISLVGIVGGLLAGAGAVVLLQQFSVVYPSRTVAIAGLVAGLLLGIVLPSVARLIPVMRVNGRIAWLEGRLNERPAPEPPSGGGEG